jgi:putative spermidine/putrescine transport system permease protein
MGMSGRAIAASKPLTRRLLVTFTALFILGLYTPFIMMFTLSFNGPTGGPMLPMRGLSLYWYEQLLGHGQAGGITQEEEFSADIGAQLGPVSGPIMRSLGLALATMVISTALGVLAAMGFRRRFRGKGVIFVLLLLGAVTPGLALGLGYTLLAQDFGFRLGWLPTGLTAHLVWTLPFSFLIMLIVFNRFDKQIEEASAVLGASPWVTFRKVTLPLVAPGVLTAALFSFTLSFDEYIRSFFSTGADQTLPLLILASLTGRVTPKLYALGSITTLISLAAVGTYVLLSRMNLRRVRGAGHASADS